MTTFTFPSGTTVELPAGMTLCRNPDTVTFDCLRSAPVGATPSGRRVFSSFSCAAYALAAAVLNQRREVAEREECLRRAAATGRWTERLEDFRDHHSRILDRMLTEYAQDPAPCICGS